MINSEICATALEIQSKYRNRSPEEILAFFLKRHPNRIALASSLGAEDQVLTDMILKIDPCARIFTLDTGRLPQETYAAIGATMRHYGIRFEIYFPQTQAVEALEREFGPDLFYESLAKRKQCCRIRKLEPLQRALRTLDVWIAGLRRAQSATRTVIEKIEWDDVNQKIKLNPLADWSADQVWQYIRQHKVPYHALHDRGFPSIGCAPCTRAVRPGEDLRSGRWWWETSETKESEAPPKECGLHYQDGKLVRRSPA